MKVKNADELKELMDEKAYDEYKKVEEQQAGD
ncbi:unnamed protein product [Gongylonema pulchrum]|uniref:Tubulin-specific chaperone A n=1 Tax=Gongylonema pulchrum TaxID=637853 RepID=A0A183EB72_9BILA|nr:unnamed protein product [Gongylonema pulchrum]VDN31283.1 unnamed protein product [Gongylonema pulchrum]